MLNDQPPSPLRSFTFTVPDHDPDSLTLASLNARHSASPTIDDPNVPTTLYPIGWGTQTSDLELPTPPTNRYDFQSNSIFESVPATAQPVATPNLAGLGINCPDLHQGPTLSFSPKAYSADMADHFLSFSPRLESSYSMNESRGSLPSFDDLAPPRWPLSLSGSAIDLSYTGLDPSGSSLPSSRSRSRSNEDLSIEALSAAAGLSIEEFTARITEDAHLALKHLADLESQSDTTTSGDPSTSTSGQDMYLDNISTLDTMVPYNDLDRIASPGIWFQPSCLGINPADIMPAPTIGSGMNDVFHDHMPDLTDVFPEFSLPPVYHPDGSFASLMGISAPTRSSNNPLGSSFRLAAKDKDDADQVSDYEPPAFLSPSSSEYSPSFGSTRQFQTRSTRLRKRKMVTQAEPLDPLPPVPSSTSFKDADGHLPPIDLGSPVFDAHRGIHIEDLKARAERYRLRNQGREYDKRWLLSFAGKLSSKGELIEEFRCYVVGCQQVNKRRDHILIHVGAHLDQRPFKCIHCSARFLRKNECKRHELSHTGVRPFTCNVCPYPGTTFVRQDLLRRHMKRTHQVDDDKENKGVLGSSRPRKKAKGTV